eukprot:TRINITY_DN46926_c0_g1_i1.p1 TRINITY_DN46926_c0_g1~~TRINITY_DN46926_c0_g1_i1.p1  ORF type:complete len:330 (-),score=122.90 TRINITY_DN46926_c0_g1_i1:48-944(-)
MAKTKSFLNRLWRSRDDESVFFDPDREATYLDRLRKRMPGDSGLTLNHHIDSGSLERWMDPEYQNVYRRIFDGEWEQADLFDGKHRVRVQEIESPNTSTFFRSFQGWLALTAQGPGDGSLRVVPLLTEGISYVLLRPLIRSLSLQSWWAFWGARRGFCQDVYSPYHDKIKELTVPIPRVEPGDFVAWHPDLVHAVEQQHNGDSPSTVLYIGVSPLCEKNARYLSKQRRKFVAGHTPPDYPQLNAEEDFVDRAGVEDLTELGRRQMGFEAWPLPDDDARMRAFLARCNSLMLRNNSSID